MKEIGVSFVEDEESCLGAWTFVPETCPAAEHLAALGEKPWTCVAGMTTNMQGQVPLARCKHFGGDDTLRCTGPAHEGGKIMVGCTFGAAQEGTQT